MWGGGGGYRFCILSKTLHWHWKTFFFLHQTGICIGVPHQALAFPYVIICKPKCTFYIRLGYISRCCIRHSCSLMSSFVKCNTKFRTTNFMKIQSNINNAIRLRTDDAKTVDTRTGDTTLYHPSLYQPLLYHPSLHHPSSNAIVQGGPHSP